MAVEPLGSTCCKQCGNTTTHVDSDYGKYSFCSACMRAAETSMAKRTVVGHLLDSAKAVFYLDFKCAFVELMWAIQRALRVGDYGSNGYFSNRGIQW
jgi:hypothetical protein